MRTILIGGTGLIGHALASNLLAAGHQVWILSRSPEKAEIPPGAQVEMWDGRTPAGWKTLLSQMDAVVNLAGENIGSKSWSTDRKRKIVESRINAGNAVVEAIKESRASSEGGPRVLVQASAIGYYGPSDDHMIDENTPPGSDFLSKVCIDWENSTRLAEEFSLRRVVIRSGLVLSLAGGVFPRILLPFRLFVGGPVGSGRQWYSWIHIQDEVEAIRFLLENEAATGPYNLTAPHPLTDADLGRVISRVFKLPYWIPAPAFALRLALGEMSMLILEGQRVLPNRLVEAGYPFLFSQAESALKNLASQKIFRNGQL